MVLGGFYKHTLSSICRYDKRFGVDETKPWLKNRIGIPTDGKTTPYFKGGYYYTRLGGASSTYPYLAGIFACALQDNTIFFTRPNWQDELIEIMQQTATEHLAKFFHALWDLFAQLKISISVNILNSVNEKLLPRQIVCPQGLVIVIC